MFGTITVEELKKRQESGGKLRLIDVREQHEYDLCSIAGAELKPLGLIGEWIGSLDKDEEIILQCHHGMRSQQACMLLVRDGFTRVHNLIGGIDLWSLRVDSSVPRY